jgi:anti-sigma factor RsiW
MKKDTDRSEDRNEDWDLLVGALVDGEMDQEKAAALMEDPRIRARVELYRHQNERIRAVFETLVQPPAPLRLREAVSRPRRDMAALRWAAAVLGLLVMGAAAGWSGAHYLDPAAPADPAFAAWDGGIATPVGERGAAPASLPALSPAFDLADLGLHEVERSVGRLGGAPALALDYLLPDGSGVTLLIQKRGPEAARALRLLSAGKGATLVWRGESTVYALSGPQPEARLEALAARLQERMGDGGAVPPDEPHIPRLSDMPPTARADMPPTQAETGLSAPALAGEQGLAHAVPDLALPVVAPDPHNL